MPVVDKQVTIRLEAEDDLTPVFRNAARSAERLAGAVDKVTSKQDLLKNAGTGRFAADLRSTAGEAGRLERAMSRAGRTASGAFVGVDRSMRPVARSMRDAADAAERVTDRYRAMSDAGRGMLLAGAGMAAGIGVVAKRYAEFDSAMSTVAANTGAVGSNLDALRSKAIELGSATQYSGKEAAQGINELAKAGVSTGDILGGGLAGALDLAAAGQIEVGQAAEIAASAMTQFGLAGSEVPRIADMLAAGANKAQGGVYDLGMALNQAGLVAASTGLSLDETVGSLTAFASAGMTGSDAGTSLKTMLQRLSPASEEASNAMEILGLSAYDSNGEFIGMAEYAGRLQESMAGLSPELRSATMNMLFGADAVRAANILYTQGEAGIRQWTAAIQAAGFAQQNAQALTNNLSGDVERLGGAIDGVVLSSGSGLNQFLRSAAQGATSVVDAFGSMPTPILETALQLGAVATAATLAGGGILYIVPKALAAKAALGQLEVTARGASVAVKTLGIATAVFAGVEIISALARMSAEAGITRGQTDALASSLRNLRDQTSNAAFVDVMNAKWNVFGDSLLDVNKKITTADEALAEFGKGGALATQDGITGWFMRLQGFGVETERFRTRVEELDSAFAQMVRNGQVDEAKTSFDQLMQAVRDNGGNTEEVAAMFGQYTMAAAEAGDVSARLTREQQMAASAALGMSSAELQAADSAEVAAKLTNEFQKSVANLGQTLLSQRDSERGFQAAIDAVTESIKQNGTSLDIHTEKGRANEAALDAVAGAGAKAAADLYATSGSIEQTALKVQQTQDAFVESAAQFGIGEDAARQMAVQFGLTTEQVVALAANMGQVPTHVGTLIELQGYEATQAGIASLQQQMDFPPAVLEAPVMGDFVRGMGTALGWAEKLENADPNVNVSQMGAAGVIAELERTTGAAQTTDKQSPQVAVSQIGAMGVQGMLRETTAAAQTTDAQSPQVEVSEQGANATKGRLADATGAARTLGQQSPNVKVGVTGAESALAKINRVLEAARNAAATTVLATVNRITGRADGAMVDYYARGGVRERHVAQIARAGAWRVWAEDETGGEAYIPLAPAKRARSTAILEEVARRFGLAVVRQAEGGVMSFAGGGTTVTAGPTRGETRLGSVRNAVIPVTAQITAITIPRGVKAPFLYTPGGPWDRSTTRPDMNVAGISKRFNDLYISKAELEEIAKKNYEARQGLEEAMGRVSGSGGGSGGGGGGTSSSALSSAPKSIQTLIRRYAQQYGIDPNLVAALIKQESGFKRTAKSSAGAQGLMQLMPGTARAMGVKDPYNAGQNIAGGVKYLAGLLKQFGGDIKKALAAYNAGPGNVRKYGGIPPFKETQNYVKNILNNLGMGGSGTGGAKSVAKAGSDAATGLVVGVIGEARKAVGTWYRWAGGHGGDNQRKTLGKALVDCSGLVNIALSKALRTNVQRSTKDWMRGGKNIKHMSVQEALNTPGAVVVRNGHMALSIGGGRIIEAPQTGKKVRERKTKASEWTKGAWDTRLGNPQTGGTVSPTDMKNLADTQKDAAQAAKDYAEALKAYNTPAYVHLAKATKEQNTYSRQFLGNLRKIRDRGYPQVAFRLLQLGEEEAAAIAASLAGAPDKVLRQQRQMFDTNAELTQQQKDLEESLGRVGGPPAWVTASRDARSSTAKAREFAQYLQRIGAADPILAQRIAAMGLDEGYDVARTVAAMPNGGVQRRAVRKDLVTDAGDAASMLAWTTKRFDTARMETFLANIDKLAARGFGTLAEAFLAMGVDAGYDLAARAVKSSDRDLRGMRANFVDQPKALAERQEKLAKSVLGPANVQASKAMAKQNVSSARFLDALDTLTKRGYSSLALHYLELGEEAAGESAIAAAAAADSQNVESQRQLKEREALDKRTSDLEATLRGWGKTINVTPGLATGSDPMVRFNAPRPVDARPAPVPYLSTAGAAAGGRSGPLVHVEHMHAVNAAEAGTALETRLGDAVAVNGLTMVG